jgi:hypothetical protein
MLKFISLPRTKGNPFTGWIQSDPPLPHHEVLYCRVQMNVRPKKDERIKLAQMAEAMDTEGRSVSIEWQTHREAR